MSKRYWSQWDVTPALRLHFLGQLKAYETITQLPFEECLCMEKEKTNRTNSKAHRRNASALVSIRTHTHAPLECTHRGLKCLVLSSHQQTHSNSLSQPLSLLPLPSLAAGVVIALWLCTVVTHVKCSTHTRLWLVHLWVRGCVHAHVCLCHVPPTLPQLAFLVAALLQEGKWAYTVWMCTRVCIDHSGLFWRRRDRRWSTVLHRCALPYL